MQLANFASSAVDFCIVEEHYDNPQMETHFRTEHHLIVGPDYLERNGLANFKRVGWQCGDYVGYVGCDHFPDYDFYWIVDSDLYLNIALDEFVARADHLAHDLLAADFREADEKWSWHKTMSTHNSRVYRAIYCLLRLSHPAVSYLKEKRSRYRPEVKGDNYEDFFANDEAFTATELAAAGFSCEKLQTALPQYFTQDLLHLNQLVHIDELKKPYARGQIIHPVCSTERVRAKIKAIRSNPEKLTQRTYRLFCSLGEDECRDVTNVSLGDLYKRHFNSDIIVNLHEVTKTLSDLPHVRRAFYWKPTTYVLDFHLNDAEFGIDITADASLYMVPRNRRAKTLVKSLFNNHGGKTCVIKQHLYINRDITLSLKKSFTENIRDFISYALHAAAASSLNDTRRIVEEDR